MTGIATLISDFAALLTPDPGNDERLTAWIDQGHAEDLLHLHAFARGLELDRAAVSAAITRLFHNGRVEGVNTTTKLIKRQMYGRAAFRACLVWILGMLRDDHPLWLMRCRDGWFLTSSGSWSSR